MARASRKQMADMRAMAVQHERTELDGRRPDGGVDVLVGGGATPSMGLSPYWGGHLDIYEEQSQMRLRHGQKQNRQLHGGLVDGDEELSYQQEGYFAKPTVGEQKTRVGHGGYRDDEALPMASGPLKRLTGGAKHLKLGNSEAFTMGHHLGKHLHALHGGDFYGDFAKGYGEAKGGHESGQYDGKGFTPSEIRKAKRLAKLHGGAWYDFLDPAKNGLNASVADTKAKFEDAGKKIKNEFENPSSKLRQVADPVIAKVKNEFENPESKLRGEYLPKIGYELGNPDSDFSKWVSNNYEKVPIVGSVGKKIWDATRDYNRQQGADKLTVEDFNRALNGPKKTAPPPPPKPTPTRYGNAQQTAKALGLPAPAPTPVPVTQTKTRKEPVVRRMKGGRKSMLGEAGRGRRAEARDERPRVMPVVEEKPKRMVGGAVSARAAIVKKVMAEHGMKMIEASKYVKAHGLY